MKLLYILLILIINIINIINCNQFEINKQVKSPIITNVTSALILHQDDTSPYLNVYISGIFSQKKMNLTVYLNDQEIENYRYQHDNSKNNTSSPDSIIFKLYRQDIVPGNITLEYRDTSIKSNQMQLKLESYVYYTKNPDVTGGILTLNGYFYYVNYSSTPSVSIGNKTTCQVLQFDNGFIKCLIDNPKIINHGDLINVSNVYNYQNSSLQFEFNAPVIDKVLNVDQVQESLITLVGTNFNEKDSINYEIYINEDKSNSKRYCSNPPVLITNSVIICSLNKSLYKTSKGDTIYLKLNQQVQPQPQQPSTEFNLISINQNTNNNNDNNNNNNNNGKSNKYLLLAIIIPTIIVFIFTIVLIIFIFKKKNQHSYFNLMNCSNELQETSYY